jgi:predicted lipoprotein with Yx(FWY)xxD motif
MGNRWLATAGIAAVALLAAACGSTSSGGSGGSGGSASGSGGSSGGGGAGTAANSSTVKTASMGGAQVLTTAKGLTIYTFARDTKNKSNCTSSSCVHFWPIVKGPVSGSGVSGTFGTITRTDGTKQATWNGHPLYTYIGDSAPGQAKGNNLNIDGGVWNEVTLSGNAPAPAPSKSSSGGGGGGYGY